MSGDTGRTQRPTPEIPHWHSGGDVVHHPIQVYRPDWSTVACIDPAASAVSRRRLLETCCERGALLLPAHFPAPHGGHVLDMGGGFALRWLTA